VLIKSSSSRNCCGWWSIFNHIYIINNLIFE
jgi:hypothetical protein